ncbi:MAG: glycerol-3-phosphate dehydrogenase/oxidase [Verrucomicrobiaceae bacterium]|nr:glycerol-3-phosphate dehydrogenase/oxidase [Verrucomicrobiaceae bacterium]
MDRAEPRLALVERVPDQNVEDADARRCHTGVVNRADIIASLQGQPLDVLVIGGGIVGSSVARDAAMRGLRVGLIEQRDFAFGTSSRSSRLLHGGIRYLAQGRIGLVHEASVEKTILHHIAPHLAAPLPFVFPTYRRNPKWKLWQLMIGVKLYDLLCGGRNLGASSWMDVDETIAVVPGLSADGLKGAVRYFDGFTNDARLVLDTLRSAARHGAKVLNYAEFVSAKHDALWLCEVESDTPFAIQAKAVVNATGPWADGLPHSAVKLRLTKGIHLVIERSRLPVADTVVMTEGSRILFAIPWGERTVLGTTDTDYDGSLTEVFADAADVAYVLRIANEHFPSAKLNNDDVISTWAGLRPLIADKKGRPSDISRSHEIKSPETNWWDVAGGKLTTCRLMAEQTIDRVIASLELPSQLCSTTEERLLDDANFSAITPPAFSREAVQHFCEQEWARHLDDVMIRRTSWHYYHRDAAGLAKQCAMWMAAALGWSDSRMNEELGNYLRLPRVVAKSASFEA